MKYKSLLIVLLMGGLLTTETVFANDNEITVPVHQYRCSIKWKRVTDTDGEEIDSGSTDIYVYALSDSLISKRLILKESARVTSLNLLQPGLSLHSVDFKNNKIQLKNKESVYLSIPKNEDFSSICEKEPKDSFQVLVKKEKKESSGVYTCSVNVALGFHKERFVSKLSLRDVKSKYRSECRSSELSKAVSNSIFKLTKNLNKSYAYEFDRLAIKFNYKSTETAGSSQGYQIPYVSVNFYGLKQKVMSILNYSKEAKGLEVGKLIVTHGYFFKTEHEYDEDEEASYESPKLFEDRKTIMVCTH